MSEEEMHLHGQHDAPAAASPACGYCIQTPINLGALEELSDKATPGPWHVGITVCQGVADICVDFDGANALLPGGQSFSLTPGLMMGDHEGAEDDAKFIAEARTAVPRLIGLLRGERDRREAAEAEINRLRAHNDPEVFPEQPTGGQL